MLRNLRNKIGGWWRKLNQPLVSELPKSVIWVSLLYGVFCIALIATINVHVSSASYQTMFEQPDTLHVDIPSVIAIIVIIFFVVMDIGLLFFVPVSYVPRLFFEWYRNREIARFTVLQPSAMLLMTLVVGMCSSMIIPTMHWQYKALKNDRILLEEMKSGEVSLEDEWLTAHQISAQQYAQKRQEVIKDGWDITHERTELFMQETIFLLGFFIVLLSVMTLRTLIGIYFVWRFYPKAG